MNATKLFRAGLQSGTIMGIADVCTQIWAGSASLEQHASWDAQRTARWASAGLLIHGPYFFYGVSRVDAHFGVGITTLSAVLKKTAAAQFILFPPYLVLLFSYMGLLEQQGHYYESIPRKLEQHVPQAFLRGCVFWPVANVINYWLVPSTLRVPYLATAAGIWNAYLSWSNSQGREEGGESTKK
jgi:protein Mpv17